MNENTLLKQFTQYLEDMKRIYPNDWQDKCPKTIHQYIPLIGQYDELNATEDEYHLENPMDSKCTALNDTIDECCKRQDEFNDLLEIFNQKHKELELQLLDNKADQVLDEF